VHHQGDARLGRLDELSEIALDAALAPGGPGLEQEVILERTQVMLGERAVDVDHRLPEAAPEHGREPEILDGRILEEVAVPDFRLRVGS
jgi:hypothetical protein